MRPPERAQHEIWGMKILWKGTISFRLVTIELITRACAVVVEWRHQTPDV